MLASYGYRKFLAVVLVAWCFAWPSAAEESSPKSAVVAKNVILMVADGAGVNTWDATSMYHGKWDSAAKRSTQVYDQPGWIHYGCTTYPLTLVHVPTRNPAQDSRVVYDPVKVWDAQTAIKQKVLIVAGYNWSKSTATDSAAAASALATGQKTYNRAINWSNMDEPFMDSTLPEIAKRCGRAVGVVTSVQWCHATPAALGGAHHAYRDEYADLANEMLEAEVLDVIMGAGHPEFDNNGKPAKKWRAKYVGGADTWKRLKDGSHPAGWQLIQTKAAFEDLASRSPARPQKTLGVAQVNATLQQTRGKYRKTDTPFSQPLNANVPTLATMSRAAINVLSRNPNGFYLMIEGGAVDWANHSNQPARMIEEQTDFLRAVEMVVAWVETHSNWDETLLILTADHDNGMLWGPNSDKVPFEPIEDRGQGTIPGMKHNSTSHSNALVPLYARGAGSQRFAELVDGTDGTAAAKWNFSGNYVDNTDVFRVIEASMAGASGLSLPQLLRQPHP